MLVTSTHIKTEIPELALRLLLKLARKYGTIHFEKKGNYYLYPEDELKNFVQKLEDIVTKRKDNMK